MAISTTSFSNTPQATGDTFVYDSLVQGDLDYIYLDVMANDLGGKAKTLYSLDDGVTADGITATRTEIQADLLAHDTDCFSAYGARIWITQDPLDGKTKVLYDPTALFQSEAYQRLSAGELMTDSFTYAIRMSNGTLSWTTATVKIYGVNDAPESSNGYGTTDEDTPIVGAALPGATDIDGDSVTYALGSTAAEHGTVTVHADGTFDYAPAANYYGTDSFSFVVKDGQGGISEYTYNLTINSVNDAAVLSAASVELNETNAPLSTGGALTISDIDSPATFQAQANTAGDYGHFSIDTAGVWTFTANAAFNELNVGDSRTDTFQVLSADGTATSVKVTIKGTNDAAVLSAATVELNETNAPLSTGGILSISDVDSPQTFQEQTNVAGSHGVFNLASDGTWSYLANSPFDALNVNDSLVDTFQVLSADGTATSVKVTIKGTNDAAVLSAATVELNETNEPLSTGGALTISDVDSPQTFQEQTNVAGSHGVFNLASDGTWSYLANSAFDALNVNDSLVDTFQVFSADGTATSVKVTIKGTNDAAVLSAATVGLNETNEPLSTGGTLSISDVDSPQTFQEQTNVAGSHGVFNLASDGTWSYLANSPFDALNVNDSLVDTFQVLSADGTATSVKVTIKGTNDAAVLSAATVELNETNEPLSTGGTLSISDVDSPQTFQEQTNVAGSHGVFNLASDGTWSYLANSAFDALNVNDSLVDTFQVLSADGTATSVKVTIKGTNDTPTIGPVTLAAIAEDSGPRLITQAQLLIGAGDVDSTLLTASNLQIASGGGSLINNDDGTWSYTPTSNDDTSVSFTYTVSDGSLSTAGSASLDITPVNDAPVNTLPGAQTTPSGTAKTISGLSVADADAASSNLTVTLQVAHGTLSAQSIVGGASIGGLSTSTLTLSGTLAQINATLAANISYVSALNFAGNDTLTMTTNDGAASDTDSLGIAVTLANNPPVATNDTLIVSEGTHVVMSVATLLGNDFDVDGAYLSITNLNAAGLTNVSNLRFVEGSNNSLIEFDTAIGGTSFGQFTYTLSDNNGGQATGTVTLVRQGIRQDTDQGKNNDTIDLSSVTYQASFIDANAGNDGVTGGGSAFDRFIGGIGNDTLIGGNGNDTLRGGAGKDKLDGGNGLDMLDLSDASSGVTFTLTQSSSDTSADLSNFGLDKDSYANMEGVVGSRFADDLTGSTGNDVIRGGAGNDVLNGGDGVDLLDLSDATGPVTFTLTQSNSGTPVNLSGAGLGIDNYQNMEGVIGSVFSDTLTGSSGNDALIGGVGADQLTGGLGADTFRYANLSEGVDSILDYSFATGDKLDFSALLGSSAPAGGLVSDYVHIVQTGADANVLVDVDGTGAAAGFVEVATLVNVEITGGSPLRASFWGGDQIIPG